MSKFFFGLLLFVGLAAHAEPTVGAAAPCIQLSHLAADGSTTTRSTCEAEKANQNMVLTFFAAWCHYCIQDLPIFDQLAQKYHGMATFRLMGVDKEKSIRDYFKNFNFSAFEIGLDPQLQTVDAFGIEGIPTLVVIGPNKAIKYVYVGVINDSVLPEIEKAIAN